ncbi:unnamed protein product [Protopolystoma xenopodis]|uniref:Uncharacterized protein n=1 Tax=Protopolystoma xenopodis TaxID=117903 RepID=A0A448WYJ9_9PLAT|nr:unnamed protein product [Protopolystoma xenopodis]
MNLPQLASSVVRGFRVTAHACLETCPSVVASLQYTNVECCLEDLCNWPEASEKKLAALQPTRANSTTTRPSSACWLRNPWTILIPSILTVGLAYLHVGV